MKSIIIFTFVAFAAILVQGSVAEEFKCEPGVAYIENECNGCFCSPTHVLGCTLKLCPEVDSAKLFNCEVGKTWTKGCNQCWCVKDQGTICTNKKC